MSTEQERIAQYQRGWNDAQSGAKDVDGSIFYAMGWLDANEGRAPRLTSEVTA